MTSTHPNTDRAGRVKHRVPQTHETLTGRDRAVNRLHHALMIAAARIVMHTSDQCDPVQLRQVISGRMRVLVDAIPRLRHRSPSNLVGRPRSGNETAPLLRRLVPLRFPRIGKSGRSEYGRRNPGSCRAFPRRVRGHTIPMRVESVLPRRQRMILLPSRMMEGHIRRIRSSSSCRLMRRGRKRRARRRTLPPPPVLSPLRSQARANPKERIAPIPLHREEKHGRNPYITTTAHLSRHSRSRTAVGSPLPVGREHPVHSLPFRGCLHSLPRRVVRARQTCRYVASSPTRWYGHFSASRSFLRRQWSRS